MEDYYFVCVKCGEAFHDGVGNLILVDHQRMHQALGDFEGFEIQPESEAM